VKRILPIVMIGMLGAWTVSAQTSASVQADVSAQSQSAVQADKSGVQASGSESEFSSASANVANNSADISSGTKIDATLAESLDAKKNKPGDRVEARTTRDIKQDGKVMLKKGAHLVGHVTQVQVRASGQTQSQLGIAFDHAVLRGGQEVPFNATIQALAVAPSSTVADTGSDDMMASGGAMGGVSGTARGGGGLVSGVASTAGATTGSVVNTATSVPVRAGATLNAATRSTGAVGGLTATGRLTLNSSGVFGLQGLSLDSAASSATQGSMIVSSNKNVHLDSGTQMLLVAGGQTK